MIMSSPADISVDIRPDFNSLDHFPSMRYIATDRPWLSKYNTKLSLELNIELAVCHSFSLLTEE
jgi:F-box protein 9